MDEKPETGTIYIVRSVLTTGVVQESHGWEVDDYPTEGCVRKWTEGGFTWLRPDEFAWSWEEADNMARSIFDKRTSKLKRDTDACRRAKERFYKLRRERLGLAEGAKGTKMAELARSAEMFQEIALSRGASGPYYALSLLLDSGYTEHEMRQIREMLIEHTQIIPMGKS